MNARVTVNPDIVKDQLFKIYKGLPWFNGIYCAPYNGRPAVHITVRDCQAARDNGVPDTWSGVRVYLWRV